MNFRDVMIGANRYVRGQGVAAEVGKFAKQLGNKAIVIGGKTALAVSREPVFSSLGLAGVDFEEHLFTSDVSENTMKYFAQRAVNGKAELVIGVGGGKAIDCSKWVADYCNLPYIAIPTSAATCASTVSLIITYTDDGKPVGGIYSKRSPDFSLVDTKIIATAPVRLLASGIGDTFSKWPETAYAARNLTPNSFIESTKSLARTSFELCLDQGEEAIRMVEAHEVGQALENIVDNNLLISGMIGNLAGHECRLAVAHCVHDGLVDLGWAGDFLHGEKVTYGTLVQMALYDEIPDDLLEEVIRFSATIGLPISLKDLGVPDTGEHVKLLSKASCRSRLQSGPTQTPVSAIEWGIGRVNALAERYRSL